MSARVAVERSFCVLKYGQMFTETFRNELYFAPHIKNERFIEEDQLLKTAKEQEQVAQNRRPHCNCFREDGDVLKEALIRKSGF